MPVLIKRKLSDNINIRQQRSRNTITNKRKTLHHDKGYS